MGKHISATPTPKAEVWRGVANMQKTVATPPPPLKGAGGGVACRTSIERDTVQYSMKFVRTEHQTLRASWGLPSMLTIVGVFDGATDKARS